MAEVTTAGGDAQLLADVAAALVAIRGAKSQAKVSMKTEVARAVFSGPVGSVTRLRAVEADLRDVGRLTGEVSWNEADGPVAVAVTLADQG